MKKFTSLTQVRDAILSKEISLPQLLGQYFEVIRQYQHLNAFNEVFFDSARLRANQVQLKIETGSAGKLAGMVIGIKDNICYKDHKVSASSRMLEDFISPYSATVTERLLKEDAIIIGRLNCDEFAMGGSNETSYYGPVKNFADPERVAGGSSGGSAAAVQAGMCLAALGTDTGGSVRQPAAFCGVIGFKPTYGRISRHGVIAYASSFDQVGTLTNSIADAAVLMEVLAGSDESDSTVSPLPVPKYTSLLQDPSPKKIAVLKETLESPALDPDIRAAIEKKIAELAASGHQVTYVSFDLLDYLVPAYYVLTMAEASANLSRYDGVRFGYRNKNAANLDELYELSRADGFGREVKRRIMLGTFILSAGYYDAYYQKAQKVRRMIRDRLEEILRSHDFILSPVTPAPAFKTGENMQDPLVMYLADIFTIPASLGGMPAISIPLGNNNAGLPLSVQLMGGKFKEAELLAFSGELLTAVDKQSLNSI